MEFIMAEVINLKQKRKAKTRSEKEIKASENRVKYGRTKEEKNAEKLKAEKEQKYLQGHKRELNEENQ